MTSHCLRPAPTRRHVLIGLASLALADCASMEPKKTPMKFFVEADQSINPDAQGNPFPVVLRIYELKHASQFNQMGFFDLLDGDAAKLGSDLVAKREIELKPGAKETFERDTPLDTRYIGAIAGFRNLENAQWRAVAEITPDHVNEIVIKVTAFSVNIDSRKSKMFGLF
jgi:type VI secretion system protein VasD